LPDALAKRIAEEARKRRFASSAALIRAAIQNELDGPRTAQDETEARLAATLDRLARQIRALSNAQQAQFAFTDALARVLLHCLPEPPSDVHDQCLARARDRHRKLLKMAAVSMKGDGRAVLEQLTSDRQ
jgi:hypothetical protein